ncbi:MAG: TIGR03643 family protein [Burkholderiaceae bacterium]|nr:TIGR03643 family protein [Burkholderiaceae bacterium]MCD8517010.1 TIGR03643 family protein [Burkholderiaceae bacterium]
MNTNANNRAQLDAATISDIIEMALSDKIGFEHIALQHGIKPDQVKELMRAHLKSGSYRAWRKRVRAMRDQRAHYK